MKMIDMNKIAEFAYNTQTSGTASEVCEAAREMIVDAANGNDFNTAVTLFTMCVNKCLNVSMCAADTDYDSEKFYAAVDSTAEAAQSICGELVLEIASRLDSVNNIDDNGVFLKYISKIAEYIFGGFDRHFIGTPQTNKAYYQFDQFERLEYVYDRMLGLTPEYNFGSFGELELKKFTEKHNILIPYFYAYAFESYNFYEDTRARHELMKLLENTEGADDKLNGNYSHDYPIKLVKEWKKLRVKDPHTGGFLTELTARPYVSYNRETNVIEEPQVIFDIDPNDKDSKSPYVWVDFAEYLPCAAEKAMPKYFLFDENTRKKDKVDPKWYNAVPFSPVYIRPGRLDSDTFELFVIAFSKFFLNEILKQTAQEANRIKDSVIADFDHTYGNMSATTLNDIGKVLMDRGHDFFEYQGRRIMTEYIIKENLTKEIKLLRIKHTTDTETLVNSIKRSVCAKGVPQDTAIERIISDSLKRCFMTLFFDVTKNGNWLRKYFSDGALLDPKKLSAWSKAFQNYVMVSKDENAALNWNNKEAVIDLKICFSDWRRALRLSGGEFAALILTELLTELFNNFFRYGDDFKPLELAFGEDGGLIYVSMKNAKKPDPGIFGSKAGLRSKRDLFSRVNKYFGFSGDPIAVTDGEAFFDVKVSIAKQLFEFKEE